MTSSAKWLSVRLRTKWFRVRVQLQSLKLQISRLLRAKKLLDIQATIECGFTLCLRYYTGHSNFDQILNVFVRKLTIFEYKGYPKNFVDFCIKKYLGKVFIKKKVVLRASKKELICVLPFLGKKSMQLRTRLVNSIESNLKFCKLKVIFQSRCKLNSLFHYKDSLQQIIPSDIVYRYMCSNCSITYYGKTCCHFFTRAAEHMGIFNLTGRRLKRAKQSAVSDHLLECNCSIDFDQLLRKVY